MAKPKNYTELKTFLASKSGLRMSHVYKPVMLLTVMGKGGKATREDIAREFALNDINQVDYYAKKIVHPMPGQRLVRDGLLEKHDNTYELSGPIAQLTKEQKREIKQILQQRIDDYLEMRNPFGDSNLDAVPGSVRYQVLKRAGGCCEACGVSVRKTQIDVDHIDLSPDISTMTPRIKRGQSLLFFQSSVGDPCTRSLNSLVSPAVPGL